MISIRINDPGSLGSWFIKETDKSFPRVDLAVSLMRHDPGSLLLIIPKERSLKLSNNEGKEDYNNVTALLK